mgnify:CR=1 FL=1
MIRDVVCSLKMVPLYLIFLASIGKTPPLFTKCALFPLVSHLRWGIPLRPPLEKLLTVRKDGMAEKDRMRKKELRVKLTDEEHAGMKKRAEAAGLDMSSYARKAIFECVIIKHEPFDIKMLANELNHIGININQIAKNVNEQGGKCSKSDMEALRKEFQEMRDSIYGILWGSKEL